MPSLNRDYTSSGGNGVVVTPSDTVDLTPGSTALHIGVAGTVSVIFADATSAIPLVVVPGCYPYRIRRVMLTDTTATGIVAIYT